jgi:hypothetical protein
MECDDDLDFKAELDVEAAVAARGREAALPRRQYPTATTDDARDVVTEVSDVVGECSEFYADALGLWAAEVEVGCVESDAKRRSRRCGVCCPFPCANCVSCTRTSAGCGRARWAACGAGG